MAITKMTATTFCENMDWIATGNLFQMPASVEVVKPTAIDKLIAVISLFLVVKPALAIISKPEARIWRAWSNGACSERICTTG